MWRINNENSQNCNYIEHLIDLHDYSTRYNYQLVVPNFRINKSKNWFAPEAHSINNKILETSLGSWLISHPFYKLSEFLNAHVDIRYPFGLSFYLSFFALF